MKISYSWLKEHLDFNLDPISTADILTDTGLEVERTETYENIKGSLSGLVVGEILSIEKHPNADRLSITKVDIGEIENYTIICGATNIEKNQKVIIAKPGVTIYPKKGEPIKIKKAKIRGQESFGMICAEDEVGLGDNHKGVVILNSSSKIGSDVKNYFDVRIDTIFEIGLTPNRADAMSHYGVARDLLVALKFKKIINQNTQLKKLPIYKKLDLKVEQSINIQIDNPKQCYRYSGVIIKNVNVRPSPNWLKEKLESIGLKPINNVVDITNYVLHNYGQPLHAFDYDKINGKIVHIKTPKKDTLFTTLDSVERKLNENDIMICNKDQEMCIGGVFGGENSGVTEKTKNIFIESAVFNPVSVRKTAKRHSLNTDASFRYERGVDCKMVMPALYEASELVVDVCNGVIASEFYDNFLNKQSDYTFQINFDNIRKTGGFSIQNKEITKILNLLEIQTEKTGVNSAQITVPNYRADVQREIDITEEIMRIYGYNNIEIPNKINSSPSLTTFKSRHSLEQKISNHLVSLGFMEMMNNSLSKESFGVDKNSIQLLNPLSKDTSKLRTSLIFGALEILKFNHFNGSPNNKFFEWGRTYKVQNEKYIESNELVITISGLQNNEHWYNGKSPSTFFQIKGIVESIFKLFGIVYYQEPISKDSYFQEGILIKNGQEVLATIGLIRKDILNILGFKETCYLAVIKNDPFIKSSNQFKNKIKAVNKFQKSYRDLSILIEEEVSMNEMMKSIKNINSTILKSISLFDIYRNKQLKGKKSYGFRFVFLHPERTLKDLEVDEIMNEIQTILKKEFNASLR
ncbi:MAG: phenylalanine--tRNA ligase subunit beta [Crocinitomicaceae bacterium]|nr:phenylalanine--tRNA ligase subunit beta [Crocinitomicaceae bacterium]